MNIIFVCNQGKNRSKTAADIFSGRFTTDSAGLYSDTPVTETQLVQADVIIVMEERHRREIAERFPRVYLQKRILVLGIPDVYRYGQPELVRLLRVRMSRPPASSSKKKRRRQKAALSKPFLPPQCPPPPAGLR